jgi:heme/copper-type cytochrome/quinol oxidase subunit 3
VSTATAERREAIPATVLGMLLFVGAETMFFAGLISAFTISRAGAGRGLWSSPREPLLPVAATLVNTAALLLRGVLMAVAGRQFARRSPAASRTLLAAWLLGAAFVGLQGREWVGLLADGLTLFSSRLGSFFYLIVGAHGVHAVAALVVLGIAWRRLRQGTLTSGYFLGAQTFWYFVVGMWPIIYARVYF